MIHQWGDVTIRNDLASSSKPIYAYLVLKAIETGKLDSLDAPVAKWGPELEELNAERGYKDRGITFRHLLNQTSGYGLEEGPGEAFAYNDHATGLLVWALFYRVYGLPPARYDELLNGDLLGNAIGFEDRPTVYHRNSPRGRIRMSARDAARFALLYLRGGRWNGKRILDKKSFQEALAGPLPPEFPRTAGREAEEIPGVQSVGGGKNEKSHLNCLGHYWWLNRTTPDGTRLLPDAPPGTFLGSGYGGRFAMIVMPELDLAAVWVGVHPEIDKRAWSPFSEVGRFRVNEMLRELLAARTEPKP